MARIPGLLRLAAAAPVLASAAVALSTSAGAALNVDVLRPVGAIPSHIAGRFEEPLGFQQASDGSSYVFDRRGHSVFVVNSGRTGVRRLVEIGQEMGRIIQPRGFDLAANGEFVIADVPRGQERIQIFDDGGVRVAGFFLPGRARSSVTIGNIVLNGIASLQYTGTTILISHPEIGALFTEYSRSGYALRSIGQLRETGHEQDRQLHLAMNAGLPLVDPTGGYYYVFLAGRPMFRKYDSTGTLLFERHVEGRELDDFVTALPTSWPTRSAEDREVPYVAPTVRTAAVDTRGQLWVSLTMPYTYVYDAHGDKVRTVQFSSTGVISPTSLSFTRAGRLLVTPGLYEFDPGRP
ncbi:MAG: hypothetical protein ABL993_07615 [Vicinamibacterales bacterium]